jgi:predicted GH43/DUF377 family glycosyl hydrolase
MNVGGEPAAASATSSEECCSQCEKTTGCVVGVYYEGLCYFKISDANPFPNPGRVSCRTGPPPKAYTVTVTSKDSNPRISWLEGNTAYIDSFNPSYIQASDGTQGQMGLLVRCQNCSQLNPGQCAMCGPTDSASLLAFAAMDSNGNFKNLGPSTIAFQPTGSFEQYGTEDPRVIYDSSTGIYYLMYTAVGAPTSPDRTYDVLLAEASTKTPLDPNSWQRYGAVFPGVQDSKSGAILRRQQPPHYLYWGAGVISLATSSDLVSWTNQQALFVPRPTMFDSSLVESGPPPLPLSTGDYLFIYNSDNTTGAYNPGWSILDGSNPTRVVARSSFPLLSPYADWATGTAPALCNVPNVIFLEAMMPTGNKDEFRVFFGGSDEVIASAIIQVKQN